jgi:hypothetical protein
MHFTLRSFASKFNIRAAALEVHAMSYILFLCHFLRPIASCSSPQSPVRNLTMELPRRCRPVFSQSMLDTKHRYHPTISPLSQLHVLAEDDDAPECESQRTAYMAVPYVKSKHVMSCYHGLQDLTFDVAAVCGGVAQAGSAKGPGVMLTLTGPCPSHLNSILQYRTCQTCD